MDLAVLIIAYSRPDGVSYLLQTLTNIGLRNIYIAIDGPKNKRDIDNQDQIKLEISKYSFSDGIKVHVLIRDQNLGVAGGVLSAIDWFFSHENQGVIIEDDLRISNDFCNFALSALTKYKDDPRVWMISGTQLFPNLEDKTQVVWTNYPMIWGWAGWAEKWIEMRRVLLCKKKIRFKSLLDHNYLFWAVGANRALSGKVDTWDTPLAFEFKNRDKLCLLPPVNLISNIGNDEVSTNTRKENSSMHLDINSLNYSYGLQNSPNEISLKKYNKLLEKNIFKIKIKHFLLPYYAFLFDYIKFPISKRKPALNERGDWLVL